MTHFFPFNSKHDSILSSSPIWANPIGNKSRELPFKRIEEIDEDLSETGISEKADTETEFSEDEENRETQTSVREDYTINFFRPMFVADDKIRRSALSEIIALLKDSLKKDRVLAKAHLANIVRFATEVPFRDISEAFRELIDQIELTKDPLLILPKPNPIPSYFIPKSCFPPPDTTNPQLHKLFSEIFVQTGRVSHLARVLALHPSFFEKYNATYNFIMREAGPLALDWRIYIAILASARYDCKWLINIQEVEFKLNGGDINWLKGIDYVPPKMKNLMDILQILTHQPWLITKKHIASLVTGADSWSIGELVHAMAIICTFKALAGLVWGCGVSFETDFEEEFEGEEEEEDDEEEGGEGNNQSVLIDTSTVLKLLQDNYEEEGIEEEKQAELFAKAETVETQPSSTDVSFETYSSSKYIGTYKMQHEDFNLKSNQYTTFRVQDYHWKEHGFELFRRFLPGAATLLDAEFDHIYQMTYNRFTKRDSVNTFRLRRAIWQYVQRIRGMFHDDYNYQEVNMFLNRACKMFIKKVVCFPDTITANDFSSVGYEFEPDEKVHIALLSVESARQSELLYGLYAVIQHMNNR